MSDRAIDADRDRLGEVPISDGPREIDMPRVETPIVPKTTIAGSALIAVVAIMTFLASLTIGAVMLVQMAASDWQSEVSREVTIQVRPASGRNLEADIGKAALVARAVASVIDVLPYSQEESARLLEPWLGSGLAYGDLPVPRIIVVRLSADAPADLEQLRAGLAAQVPTASLDDHREFIGRMRTVTRAAVAGGFAVLLLVLAATMLCVTFATRGAMATNRPVIEVLHFVGARNGFIAGHFQRHFLVVGLIGGAIGCGSAVLLFALAELGSRWFRGTATGEQLSALFGTFSLGVAGYVAVILQVGLIAFVTAMTSRYTVHRTLDSIE